MLEYAAMDTRHLPELRDRLREKARGHAGDSNGEGRMRAPDTGPRPEPVPTEMAALGVKGARAISPRALAIFRGLRLAAPGR